jgi:iron complex outermembrane receptor protein
MDIDNWIEWRNTDKWRAQNVQRVISKGIEAQMSAHIKLFDTTSDISINYSYNPAQAIENETGDVVNKQQLIYSPLHLGNFFYQLNFNKLKLFTDMSFTGKRNTDDKNTLPSHILNNGGFVYPIAMSQHLLSISAQVQNIFNLTYQNEAFFAMPGRNFKISMSLNLN